MSSCRVIVGPTPDRRDVVLVSRPDESRPGVNGDWVGDA
jgi:hypothetical protein